MKKFICISLAAMTAAVMSASAFADEPEIKVPDTDPVVQGDIMLINGENKPAFEIERWTVDAETTAVKDGVITYKTADGGGEVSIEDAVILDSKGNVKAADDIKKGANLLLYMSGPAEASNITPGVVVIKDDEGFVNVGQFAVNEEGVLVDKDNTLALNLDENVTIERLSDLREGIAVDRSAPTAEELDGRWLMVFYEDSTKSIPAQTTPSKVIALNEDAVVTAPGPVMQEQFTIDHVTVEENAKPEFDSAVIFDINGDRKTNADIKPGDVLTLFNNKAKTAVEPEYVVIMGEDENVSVDADLFVKSTTLGDYVDTQNSLALTIAEDTPIVDVDGKAVEDRDLDNKYLMVFYDKITMSIPGITNPIKVIVLGDAPADEPEATETPAEKPTMQVNSADIMSIDNVNYVPVRKYAEGLGYKVEWFGETYTVQISNDAVSANFKIDEDMYYATGADAKALGAASKLINDTTYVPVSFFEDILGVTTVMPIAE